MGDCVCGLVLLSVKLLAASNVRSSLQEGMIHARRLRLANCFESNFL